MRKMIWFYANPNKHIIAVVVAVLMLKQGTEQKVQMLECSLEKYQRT